MTPEYICLECGSVFSEPHKFVERHGLDTPPFEEYYGCPECGGNYAPVMYCDHCGEVITGDYVRIQGEATCYCDKCYMVKSLEDIF